jgi:hypothetical protein
LKANDHGWSPSQQLREGGFHSIPRQEGFAMSTSRCAVMSALLASACSAAPDGDPPRAATVSHPLRTTPSFSFQPVAPVDAAHASDSEANAIRAHGEIVGDFDGHGFLLWGSST